MQIKQFAALGVLAVFLSSCGGDINISDDTVSPPGPDVGGPPAVAPSGPCAFFFDDNDELQQGAFDGLDCTHSSSFVDFDNPLTQDMTLENFGEGAHIFSGSLFVGENFDTLGDAAAAGITQGGDGPTLTIEPGVTVALQTPTDFVAIQRGSQLMAIGTPTDPITFTSEQDIRGLTDPEETQTWGGLAIAGFGFLNNCLYEPGFDPDTNPVLELPDGVGCSDLLEGTVDDTSVNYGGTVPEDNSGVLNYVVVKHAGFAITDGNELNGITFGAVGSETTLSHIEIYSNFDDGVEFFGGGADLDFYLAMYIRDDSIDLDQGYYGTITNALVIQAGGLDEPTPTGAHCVESDGSAGGTLAVNQMNDYITQATINNLTCIISAKGPTVAGNGDPGAGINVEEGHELTLNSALVTTAYAADAVVTGTGPLDPALQPFTNYCFQLEDPADLDNALNGEIRINTSIFACADLTANGGRDAALVLNSSDSMDGAAFPDGTTGVEFLEAQDNILFATAADGSTPPDSAGGNGEVGILNSFFSLPLDQMMIDGQLVTASISGTPNLGFIGGVTEADDWTQGWTFGLNPGSRDQDLWFEVDNLPPILP